MGEQAQDVDDRYGACVALLRPGRVQVAPIGVTARELRFLHLGTGEVGAIFQFPSQRSPSLNLAAALAGQLVIVHRIGPPAAGITRIPIAQWTGDPCDWAAVCAATRIRLKVPPQVTFTHLLTGAAGRRGNRRQVPSRHRPGLADPRSPELACLVGPHWGGPGQSAAARACRVAAERPER